MSNNYFITYCCFPHMKFSLFCVQEDGHYLEKEEIVTQRSLTLLLQYVSTYYTNVYWKEVYTLIFIELTSVSQG